MKYILFLLTILSSVSLFAQSQEPNSAEILLNIQKLNTVGSVLYIAAHPDDENTRLLGYLAKEQKLRTGYLSLTRGDGGQNLIGKEQGEALGLIRTQELLAARRTDGAEQFFTRANDFGFSKNPEETFNIWNKDSVLADVVLAIRKFKPDVIICRFPTTGEGGHGHHTASAILALEAFDLAADPTKFPEQLKEYQVWQTKRIFWNTFNFGSVNTTADDQLKLDVGVFNPLLGINYGEVAANSRSMHKSQGFGSSKQRGATIEYFKFLNGTAAKESLFEGIDQSWGRISKGKQIGDKLKLIETKYDLLHPEKSVKPLLEVYKMLQGLDGSNPEIRYWKIQKLRECEELLLACSGIWLEANTKDFSAVPDSKVALTAQVIVRNPVTVSLTSIRFPSMPEKAINATLTTNKLEVFEESVLIPVGTEYSAPYWLNNPHEIGRYTVLDAQLIGTAENSPAQRIVFNLNIEGTDILIERPLVYKSTDPVKGEVYRPFEILPAATLNLTDEVLVFSELVPKQVSILVKANTNNLSGMMGIEVPKGWNVTIENPEINLLNKGDEILVKATLTPLEGATNGQLKPVLTANGLTYSKSITRIEYDHIPFQFFLTEASARIVLLDLKKTKNKIAYIPGAGDNVPTCLAQIGYDITILTDDLLATEDLSQYASIVTGVRAYNTNPRLKVQYDKLMTYVKNGGNLIVQYNTNNRQAPLETKIGPYPFAISRDRVTVETASVEFTNPTHSALNFPNKITSSDFDGWIQERGIYFGSELDEKYETVITMNDPNENPASGSLIIAKYGKGNFVYTGLVFFRELPAGVPGAYRLFVNLLSLPQNN